MVYNISMMTYKEYKERALKNPNFKREYEKLRPEYELAVSLARRRVERKMTQGSLAQKLHTKQSAISRLESGLYNPTLGFLKNVATALGCKLNISLS